MRAPPFDLVCKWIVESWAVVSTEIIKKSFQVCGMGLSVCGDQDHEISVFKPGHGCEAGLEMLKAAEVEQEQAYEEDIYEEEHLLLDSDEEDDEIVDDSIVEDDGISDDQIFFYQKS